MDRRDNRPGNRRCDGGTINVDTLHRICQENAMAFVVINSEAPLTTGMDTTLCHGPDGSKVIMTVMDGRMSINGVILALDDEGFVVHPASRTRMPRKYQDFYRLAVAERKKRLMREIDQLDKKCRQRRDVGVGCGGTEDDDGLDRSTRASSFRRRLEDPGNVRRLVHFYEECHASDADMNEKCHLSEKCSIWKTVNQLADELCHRINEFDTAMKASMNESSSDGTGRDSRQHLHSAFPSICNIFRAIHLWRRRRRSQLLLENEHVYEDLGNDVIVRASRDALLLARELQQQCHQLAGGYCSVRKLLDETHLENQMLAKTIEGLCDEALAREADLMVTGSYRTLSNKFWKMVLKKKGFEVKARELEKENRELIKQRLALQVTIEELTSSNKRPTTRHQKEVRNVSLQVDIVSPSMSSSSTSSLWESTNDLLDCPTRLEPQSTKQRDAKDEDTTVIEKTKDNKTTEKADDPKLAPETLDVEKIKIAVPQMRPQTLWEQIKLHQTLVQMPVLTGTLYDALQPPTNYWQNRDSVKEWERTTSDLINCLRAKCDTVNDENKRLENRLDLSQKNAKKLHKQLRQLLSEKERLQDHMLSSRALQDVSQWSVMSQLENNN